VDRSVQPPLGAKGRHSLRHRESGRPAVGGAPGALVPATVAGVLAAVRRGLAPVGRAEGRFDVELLAARPIHHSLELAGLFGLLEGLAAAAPPPRVRLWLRSALHDERAFAALPAAARRRLPDATPATGAITAITAPAAEVLAEIRAGGAVCVLLGDDAGWERRLDELPAWWRAPLPHDFQWRLPAGHRAEEAVRTFRFAAAAATPRWVITPPPTGGDLCRQERPQPAAIRRILIHQARSHLGDALWLTPLLRGARHRFPHAAITVLAAAGQAALLAANPHVAEVLTLPPAGSAGETGASDAARFALAATLAQRGFDAALFAFVRRPGARWLAEAAADLAIPWRVNLEYFDQAGDGGEPSPLFTHEGWFFWGSLPSPRLLLHALDPLEPEPPPRASPPVTARRTGRSAASARDLAPALSGASGVSGLSGASGDPTATGIAGTAAQPCRLDLPLPAPWHHAAERALADAGIGGQPFAVLAPGAHSSARWPARKFAALAVRLAADLGLHVLIEGGPADAAALAAVASWLRAQQAATTTPASPLATARARRPRRRGMPAADAAAGAATVAAASAACLDAPPDGAGGGRIAIRQDSFGALAALLARASLLVGNDSAPIHLAALAATPTLYLAHREKLVHSHPGGPLCRALYDAARNRPARIPVSAAFAAVAAMAHDGLISAAGTLSPVTDSPAAPLVPLAQRQQSAQSAPPAPAAAGFEPCEGPFCMLHFLQQIDRLLLPLDVQPWIQVPRPDRTREAGGLQA
jgi:ADP-heptose:LPS heptosyltransferase